LVGVTVNVIPLHVTVLIGRISAVGGTVTVNVNVRPVQLASVFGVTIYVAVLVSFTVLRSVPKILSTTFAPLAPPVIVAENVGIFQVYFVANGTIPSLSFSGVTLNVTPLHVTVVKATISGVGFTYTVTVNILPTQVPDFGITLYVAVNIAFVRFNNLPVIMVG
jgi:hypothetical protein